MRDREHWKNRSIFIMAAVGAAIGLGNIWRFPYIAAQNGGGAFLVPYLFALFTAGIPIMIIEYGLGQRSMASANIAMGAIRKPFRIVGWLGILSAFVINIYYCIVMGWLLNYLIKLLDITSWAVDIETSGAFFMENILHVSKGPWDFERIHPHLLIGLVLTWIIIWAIIKGGLGKIGKVLLFTVPFPVILILILVVRGLTLEGATVGLNYYLSPDWAKLADSKVWLAAYGQIFFSLSVGFGTMIVFSSFMPRDTELPNSAAITSFTNCAFSFLAGFAIFSILGYFAYATNVPIEKIADKGPGLAFVVYPVALAKLPLWIKFFALLFFFTLLLLGIDSAFSLLETVGAALSDKFDFSRTKSTTIVAVISFALGIPFTTSAGLFWLDIVDHFKDYPVTIVAILECIAVGWFLGSNKFIRRINKNAEIRLGLSFSILIKFITPAILLVVAVVSFINEIEKPYSGYPLDSILILGVGMIIAIIIGSVILSYTRTKNEDEQEEKIRSTEQEEL